MDTSLLERTHLEQTEITVRLSAIKKTATRLRRDEKRRARCAYKKAVGYLNNNNISAVVTMLHKKEVYLLYPSTNYEAYDNEAPCEFLLVYAAVNKKFADIIFTLSHDVYVPSESDLTLIFGSLPDFYKDAWYCNYIHMCDLNVIKHTVNILTNHTQTVDIEYGVKCILSKTTQYDVYRYYIRIMCKGVIKTPCMFYSYLANNTLNKIYAPVLNNPSGLNDVIRKYENGDLNDIPNVSSDIVWVILNYYNPAIHNNIDIFNYVPIWTPNKPWTPISKQHMLLFIQCAKHSGYLSADICNLIFQAIPVL